MSKNYNLIGVNSFTKDIVIDEHCPKNNDVLGSLTKAGQFHKAIRKHIQPYLKPKLKLVDLALLIENKTYELAINDKCINGGIGFPASLSINNCAAHFHPKSNDKISIDKDDLIKIDFGTEINGWIVDSAFTICFDHKYDNLLNASKEATYTGLKNIGIDVNIADWGREIQEVMESYEITLNNKTYPIKSIANLGGHNIIKGVIHGGVFLPCVDTGDRFPDSYRFKEGVHAVETFASTGDNYTEEKGVCTLYRLNPKIEEFDVNNDTKNVLNIIKNSFKTLPFTDRYIEKNKNYKSHLNTLSENKIIFTYPPLYVNESAYVAQYEHTVYIGDNKKIIFSNDEDY